jgi:hypothetical protein
LRYFFRRHLPPVTRILLIESGSRNLLEKVIPSLLAVYGDAMEIDLVTCYAGVPLGFTTEHGELRGKVFRVPDYGGGSGRSQLWADLAPRNYTLTGIICAAEPIMTKWKWWLGAKVPAKIFVINENGDYFWLDWAHWRLILKFALYRAGLTGSAAVPALVRLVLFPLTLSYLLLYAGWVHFRRWMRVKSAP